MFSMIYIIFPSEQAFAPSRHLHHLSARMEDFACCLLLFGLIRFPISSKDRYFHTHTYTHTRGTEWNAPECTTTTPPPHHHPPHVLFASRKELVGTMTTQARQQRKFVLLRSCRRTSSSSSSSNHSRCSCTGSGWVWPRMLL